ncbi:transmembrane protein 200A-like [Myxocyprinus asiaticus]|uniref:transmembrane protein 200A-like n=1 Tax=Myxocyprinus asiaticus TaxID=70543 RepID=UPI00222202E4|nr:transmembrane protein 200A-like [Myxocyprinus asiaticus]XP_051500828.1 transmembrane protein 200A-like [Myxocyprinus asiaticus]XP_051500829.1 transmembrane protein 200A-like [Myxocyprinus asiaticus]
MIATGGVITGLAALKRQDSTRSQYHLPTQSPTPAPEKKCAKRKSRADVVVVRGKIRLYSASGFFLVLGLLILMAGIVMAVLGYWPHKDHQKAPESKLFMNNTQVGREQIGSLTQFFEQHLHSEKMKMLGPFTMGIGIFIFICANAILHENRDRETKIIHMRDMYSTVIDFHSLRIKEQKCTNGAYMGPYADTEIRSFGQDSHFASRLTANTLMSFSGLDSDLRFSHGTSSEDEEGLMSEAKGGLSLLSPAYKDQTESFFGFQCESSRQCEGKSGVLKKCQTRSIVSSSICAFTLPVIKLNNCVIDEPDIESITEDLEQNRDHSRPPSMESLTVPVPDVAKAFKRPGAQLLRSNSATESPSSTSSHSSLSPGSTSGRFLSPGAARKDFGSNNSLQVLSAYSKSLDLERESTMLTVHPEQRKHPSWPRLDCSNSKGYTKLENKEDYMDRLIVPPVAVKKDYTKKEKLLMISRSHNNLCFEHDEFLSSLKRGTSETRF